MIGKNDKAISALARTKFLHNLTHKTIIFCLCLAFVRGSEEHFPKVHDIVFPGCGSVHQARAWDSGLN